MRPSRSSSLDPKSPVWLPTYQTHSAASDPSVVTDSSIPQTVNVVFSPSSSKRAPTILLFNDDTGYLASDYWLEGTQLHMVTPDGRQQVVPVGKLNLDETVRQNKQRDVDVVLRTLE